MHLSKLRSIELFKQLACGCLAVLFLLCQPTSRTCAEALSSAGIGSRLNLFAVPLEDILNIRVDSGMSERNLENSILTFSKRSINRATKKAENSDYNTRFKVFRGILQHLQRAARNEPAVVQLAINGYKVDDRVTETKLLEYFRTLLPQVRNLEVFTGDSARWWSNDRARYVINFVLNDQNTAGAPAVDRANEEVVE